MKQKTGSPGYTNENKRKSVCVSMVLTAGLVVAVLLAGSCASTAFAPPPYIPAPYYRATEINPQALVDAYYWGNVDWTSINAKYNNEIYVMKNVVVDQHMTIQLNQGFIWIDRIQCFITNLNIMKSFSSGDKIDVVGRNAGPTNPGNPQDVPELYFVECIVIPAGLITLPVDSNISPAQFGPAY